MPGDAFEQLIRKHLDNLHRALAAEYRLATEHLEGRIAAWEEEKRQQYAQHEDDACNSLPGSCNLRISQSSSCCMPRYAHTVLGETVTNNVDDRSSGDVHLPELLPSGMSKESGHRHSRSSTRATDRCSCSRASQKEPALPEYHSLHKDGDESPQGDGASTHFKVLDIWDNPRLRTTSRKISVHSMDRLSAMSVSFASTSNYNSQDDSDGVDSPARWWIERSLQHLVIPPSSLQYLSWEILGLTFVAYDIVTIPLQIFDLPQTTFLFLLSWLVRCFWTCDILISFLTGYVSPKGLVELRPARVASKYFHTRFCFDLALVSCDWVEALLAALEGGQSSEDAAVLRLLSMLRAIRLMRLLRLIKSQKISEFIFEHIRSEGVKLVTYILLVMLLLLCLLHVIACMWHGIRHASGISWQGSTDDRLAVQYFTALHYVLSLFAGEQLREPENLPERLFVIAVLVLALVVSAAFVGSLTTAMIQLQIIASKRSSQFAALNRYLSDYGISRGLAGRVQNNARHALREQKRHTPESNVELMVLISDSLRSEIHYEVYSPVLTAHPFFCLYNKVNHVGVRHICHTAVCSVSLSRGDVIFSEFEIPVSPRMFFVVSGRLVYVRTSEGQQNVVAKQWVAEGVLWTKWAHRGTLRALTESRLLSLDAHRVANIMTTFPTVHGFNYANKFVESLNQAAPGELTDIPGGEEPARQMAACVFQELDRCFDVPWETRCRRPSSLSVGSLVSSTRLSFTSRRSSVVSVVPAETAAQ
mmetsp:Transcript_27514/g.79072  ORF Transcript_27514/g.79072 Transcript_27514/m.79072 type:complete len:759 (+) Transcript_27514:64-2340(+)